MKKTQKTSSSNSPYAEWDVFTQAIIRESVDPEYDGLDEYSDEDEDDEDSDSYPQNFHSRNMLESDVDIVSYRKRYIGHCNNRVREYNEKENLDFYIIIITELFFCHLK